MTSRIYDQATFEYLVNGWFDMADVRFEFEALPKGVPALYDGSGWAMSLKDRDVVWEYSKKKTHVTLLPKSLMAGTGRMLFKAMMQIPCKWEKIRRVIAPLRGKEMGLLILETRDEQSNF